MVICFANNKGGVSKTTTATTLATIFKDKGFSVLLVDTDPQCSATDLFRIKTQGTITLYDVLINGDKAEDAIYNTEFCDVIPSDPLLRDADIRLTGVDRNFKLREALEPILDRYDFILIDTPPSQGILLINALTVADTTIVPTTIDRISLAGLSHLFDILYATKKYTNPKLRVSGLLAVRFEARTILARQLMNDQIPVISEMLGVEVFKTTIRDSVVVKEAQTKQIPLIKYDIDANVTKDYLLLADELLQKEMNK